MQSKAIKFKSLTIGTRGSPLALRQAQIVREAICAAHGVSNTRVEILVIKTSGDKIQDRPLSEVGGKGLFTKEIETALLEERIDLAVHSSKDMATGLPDGLVLSAILPREDPRDGFISRDYAAWQDLPQGATVGSSSIRRRAQLAKLRPDIKFVEFRGNVQTRLEKLENGVASATFLATAGLKRLDMDSHVRQYLERDDFLSAPGQGIIAVQTRQDDMATNQIVAPLHDLPSAICLQAERSFLRELDGSCRTPIAALAEIIDNDLQLEGEILSRDGQKSFRDAASGSIADAARIGAELGAKLRDLAGPEFIAELEQG